MRAIKINKTLKKSGSSSWNQVFYYIKIMNIINKFKRVNNLTKKNNKKCKPMIRGKLDFVLVFHKNKAMLINVKQNEKSNKKNWLNLMRY